MGRLARSLIGTPEGAEQCRCGHARMHHDDDYAGACAKSRLTTCQDPRHAHKSHWCRCQCPKFERK